MRAKLFASVAAIAAVCLVSISSGVAFAAAPWQWADDARGGSIIQRAGQVYRSGIIKGLDSDGGSIYKVTFSSQYTGGNRFPEFRVCSNKYNICSQWATYKTTTTAFNDTQANQGFYFEYYVPGSGWIQPNIFVQKSTMWVDYLK